MPYLHGFQIPFYMEEVNRTQVLAIQGKIKTDPEVESTKQPNIRGQKVPEYCTIVLAIIIWQGVFPQMKPLTGVDSKSS